MQPRRSRIFIVDDSVVMQNLLCSVIASDPELELAGIATNGASALSRVSEILPDLIVLDVEMPVMDGLAALKNLRTLGLRMPVIMCSSLTHRGATVTVEALAFGASDYISKPRGHSSPAAARHSFAMELLPKIHALTTKSTLQHVTSATAFRTPSAATPSNPRTASGLFNPRVVVIGASTGGPAALEALLPALPANFPIPVLIVQHMPELFTQILAERLCRRSALNVREASEGNQIGTGSVFIARGNWHLEITAAGSRASKTTLHLSQSRPENHCRPSVDVLFRSASEVYGAGVLAVVLTGMGSDGLEGSRLIRARGGRVIVQDELSSTVWGMPGAIARTGIAHRIHPLYAIGSEIVRLAGCAGSDASGIRGKLVS